MIEFAAMERKARRTIIAIPAIQPTLDFDDAEKPAAFSLPEYQKGLLLPRTVAGLIDAAVVVAAYILFAGLSFSEMPKAMAFDRKTLAVYGMGFLLLLTVYLFLFMLSASQTPGMKARRLAVVNSKGDPLSLGEAFMRGFGYLISIAPVLIGFVWAFIDPEHLTWADKVSGTFVKKV